MIQTEHVSDGITYDRFNRMLYHPEFHFNHGKTFSGEELEYLCMFYGVDHVRSLAFALGRTEHTIRVKYDRLRREGLVDMYRLRYQKRLEAECRREGL